MATGKKKRANQSQRKRKPAGKLEIIRNVFFVSLVVAVCVIGLLLLGGGDTLKEALKDNAAMVVSGVMGLGVAAFFRWLNGMKFRLGPKEGKEEEVSGSDGGINWEAEYRRLYGKYSNLHDDFSSYYYKTDSDLGKAYRKHELLVLMVVAAFTYSVGSCIATLLSIPDPGANGYNPSVHPMALVGTFGGIAFVFGLISILRLEAGGGGKIKRIPVAVGLTAAFFSAIVSLLVSAPYQSDWFGENARPGPNGFDMGHYILILRLLVIPVVSFLFCGLGVLLARKIGKTGAG